MRGSRNGNKSEGKGEGFPLGEPVKRWIALTLILGALLGTCAAVFIWLQIQRISDGYRLAECQEEYEQLMADQRKLHLQWNQLQDPFYLERLARERFGLAPPKMDQRILVR